MVAIFHSLLLVGFLGGIEWNRADFRRAMISHMHKLGHRSPDVVRPVIVGRPNDAARPYAPSGLQEKVGALTNFHMGGGGIGRESV